MWAERFSRRLIFWMLPTVLVVAFGACRHSSARSGGAERTTGAKSAESSSLREKIRRLDEGALQFIEKLDGPGLLAYRKRTGITICGIHPIAVMLTVLKDSGLPVGVRVLDYYTSGDTTGDWTNTVSYYSIAFFSKNGVRRAHSSQGRVTPVSRTSAAEAGKGRGDVSASGHGKGADLPVRPMVTGPGWYPKNAPVLRRMLHGFLNDAKVPELGGPLLALISPHAGYRFSGRAAAHGYKLLGLDKTVRRVVLLGVSHHVGFRGVSVGEFRAYQTPFGPLPLDEAAAQALRKHRGFGFLAKAHAQEHSLEMQMPLLKLVQPGLRILPMLVGFVSAQQLDALARPLVPLLDGATVFVASSDFTHRGPRYGYQPFAGGVDTTVQER